MKAPRRPTHRRGFTLVELMVALSGGLFVSVMVFALARDTSRFYQREGRLASATLAGMMGFERLKADIARAGYLSTPNIVRDPRVCPAAGRPTQLARLASVRINADTPSLSGNAAISGAGLTPDEIVLAGSYGATDEFPLRQAAGNTLFLQMNVPPMARLGYLAAGLTAAEQQALLGSVFRAGRILRITDNAGLQHFGVIANVTGGLQPQVTLAAAPALVYGGGAQSCGIQGDCTGCLVSVINVIRYQVRDLKADGLARFAPLWTASAAAPGEATRTELVRQELDAAGNVIETGNDLTTELIAEYAVDLGFSVTAQLPLATDAVDLQPGGPNFTQIFDATPANVGNPQRVRAVRARLSVRSREADRDVEIPGGLYRFRLPDTGVWARVRTFQADIGLPNQEDILW
ncbi:MAG TPA: prepilin-type N-terminal cleavage/methylation domain-containing protein [Polyangiaceae bacterium]